MRNGMTKIIEGLPDTPGFHRLPWNLPRFGKPKLTRQQIDHAKELRAKGNVPHVIADILSVSRATFYRALAV
jgi:hypothetical protein